MINPLASGTTGAHLPSVTSFSCQQRKVGPTLFLHCERGILWISEMCVVSVNQALPCREA